MTIAEAARQGIKRLRLSIWANADAYVKIDLLPGGFYGPWGKLYERKTQEAIGEPTPQVFLLGGTSDEYTAYDGPLDREDK